MHQKLVNVQTDVRPSFSRWQSMGITSRRIAGKLVALVHISGIRLNTDLSALLTESVSLQRDLGNLDLSSPEPFTVRHRLLRLFAAHGLDVAVTGNDIELSAPFIPCTRWKMAGESIVGFCVTKGFLEKLQEDANLFGLVLRLREMQVENDRIDIVSAYNDIKNPGDQIILHNNTLALRSDRFPGHSMV